MNEMSGLRSRMLDRLISEDVLPKVVEMASESNKPSADDVCLKDELQLALVSSNTKETMGRLEDKQQSDNNGRDVVRYKDVSSPRSTSSNHSSGNNIAPLPAASCNTTPSVFRRRQVYGYDEICYILKEKIQVRKSSFITRHYGLLQMKCHFL